MLADPYPGYLVYCTARPGSVNRASRERLDTVSGGRAREAPLLAGSFALVDAELRTHGYPNIGFANPLLYKIARSHLPSRRVPRCPCWLKRRIRGQASESVVSRPDVVLTPHRGWAASRLAGWRSPPLSRRIATRASGCASGVSGMC